ncbi:cation-transporting P-type ATPase [Pontibacter sp. G13]|uniref:cation-translocating P-type ATPase n=1 Tax=Pontibacter sp. G13 TaxID=3074898 RepID=UPI0028890DD6|nr:cation-transporting P-type ATPase [Pontibacter sp. G13]WNJ21099.1 cation-transporting P-type ATPase [Pontibacter sp. G13]
MESTNRWHLLSPAEVLKSVDTHPNVGLSPQELAKRRETFGENVITQKKGDGALVLLLKQFNQPLIYILLVAAVGVAILGEWVEMWVILAVVIVNAIIGFVQEARALKAIEALSKDLNAQTQVLREGQPKLVPVSELVPGDVVLLHSGDRVPADLRILQERQLQIDESALTGESLPVEKQPNALESEAAIGDRTNMAYSSTMVTYGTGRGVVVSTGDHTQIGQINRMIASADVLATPLTQKINQFSHIMLWVILALAGMTVVSGILRGFSLNNVLLEGVALAVGSIPEGLPAVVTITLAIGVSRMAKRKAIIRKLPAVETLGSTTVICSDKTGTLTQNEMTVQKIWTGGTLYDVSGVGYDPQGKIHLSNATEPLHHPLPMPMQRILEAGILCNDSRLVEKTDGWIVEGDPTEGALITSAWKGDCHPDYRRLDTIPFESEYQYMATLNQVGADRIMFIKGSVERVLPACEDMLTTDGTAAFSSEDIQAEVTRLAGKGLRVLAFAQKNLAADTASIDHPDVRNGLTFLGLQAMIDPPRPEAIQAVQACQEAGVQVKMITGDHLGTAVAIAKKLGIEHLGGADEPVGITGMDMAQLNDEDFVRVAREKSVFARVSPAQKLELVKALQAEGHIAAMTGDGVNDAPALRQANIGVAMGITGTEVAKETADMILTDDNFASIEAAVEEGRSVFDNIVKFITWTLPTNISEGLVILIASLLGRDLPITPLQILWINLTTAVFLGATLAFEDKEPGIMRRLPRKPGQPLLGQDLIFRIIWVSLVLVAGVYILYEVIVQRGYDLEVARTAAVNLIVFGELFYLFNCRSLTLPPHRLGFYSNRWLLIGVAVMIGLQMLFTYAPWMNRIFGTEPIGPRAWVAILGMSFLLFGLVEIEKSIRRRSPQN